MEKRITRSQFRSYERVRQVGHYNMLDSRARALTGLDKDMYMQVLKNYNKLTALYPEVCKEVVSDENE